MLEVTDNAKRELRRVLMGSVTDPNVSFRLRVNTGCHPEMIGLCERGDLGLTLGIVAPGDTIIEYEGTKVLLVGGWLAAAVEDIVMDVEDSLEGPQIIIFKKPVA